jgi:nitric oxide reductase subunit C
MTKRHTRLFFIAGTLIFAAVFLGLTVHSHTQFGELTNADQITPDVVEGKHVWHRNNCINCHTLLGEGAYYAPDLTKITQHRGEAYLRAFLRNPSQFYSEEQHGRLMPNPNLTEEEIGQVIAFLDWVGRIDNQGWPPRPILVSGSTLPGMAPAGPAPEGPASHAPAALGEHLFRSAEVGCFACHSISEGVNLAGPSLAGLANRAEQTVADPAYAGTATDAAGYIRESILQPSAHIVPGANFATAPTGGVSLMPADYGTRLDAGQIDQLIAYLSSLR